MEGEMQISVHERGRSQTAAGSARPSWVLRPVVLWLNRFISLVVCARAAGLIIEAVDHPGHCSLSTVLNHGP